jgi:predicted TIM-barrel fold metal-dependent hydrolase
MCQPDSLSIVDSHIHVWTGDRAFSWAADGGEPPQRDAHPEMLLASMQAACVDFAVLVQYIGYRWDNTYSAAVLRAFPDKFLGVCRVDPEDPSAPDHLSYWTETHGFRGVRLSPAPDARGDWFCGPSMGPLFRRAADLHVPVVLLTKSSRLPDLAAILEAVPDVDVVIDHMADCVENNPAHLQLLLTLARYPRVFLKTGHMWANSVVGYPWRDQLALVKRICKVYGAERVMWGSDWPFCLHHATYAQSLTYLREEDVLSPEELAWVLGGTARRLWPFPQVAGPDAARMPGRDGHAPRTLE